MLVITETPLIEKKYKSPDDFSTLKTYVFNTVGVLDNIYIGVTSYEMPLNYIDGLEMAVIHCLGDFVQDLKKISDTEGNIYVWLQDNDDNGYNYSGNYRLTNITFDGTETSAVLNFVETTGATFFGEKYFPQTTYSQIVFRKDNRLTFTVYERLQLAFGFINKQLTTVHQEMNVNGTNHINLSEIALSYIKPTGCVVLQIDVSEIDRFGNTSKITSRPISFIYGSIPEVNYYKYILFNPVNDGLILPTTYDKLYYTYLDNVYPFYVNFILQDEGLAITGNVGKIIIRSYMKSDPAVQNSVQDTIQFVRGLNVVDISKITNIENILNYQIDYITIQFAYQTGAEEGEFTTQFTPEFMLSGGTKTVDSSKYAVNVEEREFNDRRDFYIKYNNGIGGISTLLSTNFEEEIDPEIVSLRNRETLNNIVVRSTEVMKVTFDQIDLYKLKQILGFEPQYMFKTNGIYESDKLTRIGADGSEKEYIIRSSKYNKNNQDLYNTISVEIFRPMNSGFQQIGDCKIETKIRDITGNIKYPNLMDNGLINKRVSSVNNVQIGELKLPITDTYELYSMFANVCYKNAIDGDSGIGIIQIGDDGNMFIYDATEFGDGRELVGLRFRSRGGVIPIYARTVRDAERTEAVENPKLRFLDIEWLYVINGNSAWIKSYVPSVAEQERSGKTTITVDSTITPSNVLVQSIGVTCQDGDDYQVYEIYDFAAEEGKIKIIQLLEVKAVGVNVVIQVFVRTSQGTKYGDKIYYKS